MHLQPVLEVLIFGTTPEGVPVGEWGKGGPRRGMGACFQASLVAVLLASVASKKLVIVMP